MNEAYVAYLLLTDQWNHPDLMNGRSANSQLDHLLLLIQNNSPTSLWDLFEKTADRKAVAYVMEIIDETNKRRKK